jgi:hypothetical protein
MINEYWLGLDFCGSIVASLADYAENPLVVTNKILYLESLQGEPVREQLGNDHAVSPSPMDRGDVNGRSEILVGSLILSIGH